MERYAFTFKNAHGTTATFHTFRTTRETLYKYYKLAKKRDFTATDAIKDARRNAYWEAANKYLDI